MIRWAIICICYPSDCYANAVKTIITLSEATNVTASILPSTVLKQHIWIIYRQSTFILRDFSRDGIVTILPDSTIFCIYISWQNTIS